LELLTTLSDTPERARQELSLHIALGATLAATKGYGNTEAERVYSSLWGANLAGAKFGVAKLADADLEGANLADADLEGANLAGADLQQVRGLTQDQLKRVCGDKATKLPAGLTLPAECPDLPPCFDPPCPDPPPLPPVPCPIRPLG
jgi:hypothetical protein